MTWKPNWHPADSADPAPEEQASAEEASVSEEIAPSADPLAQLRVELEAAKTDAEQWRDRFLRKAAELDNYRKRSDRERAESALLAKSSVLLEFLPVADACERALRSLDNSSAAQGGMEQYRQGVALLYRQMLDSLARMGVAPIEALGQKFDPHLHEALIREETKAYEEHTVLQELRRGYMFKDRLLRPSQVKVSTRPEDES
jgi:molecular chaperone GrpE